MGRCSRTVDSRFFLAGPIAVHEQDWQPYPVDMQPAESDNTCTKLLRLYSPRKVHIKLPLLKTLPSRLFVDDDRETWVFSLALSTGEGVIRRLLGSGCRLIPTIPKENTRTSKTKSNFLLYICSISTSTQQLTTALLAFYDAAFVLM